MSGPQYPPPPAPGSNAIGSFEIGVSPIGTIRPFDPLRTVISQYANSDRLMRLIENFDDYVDQTANMEKFFDDVWNIDTAVGWGLDVQGRRVGVRRVLKGPSTLTTFGFQEANDPALVGFGQGTFYTGQALTANYTLTDPAYRQLILAKALANICDGSIPALNKLLMRIFPNRGNAYVADGKLAGPLFGFAESISGQPFGQAPFNVSDDLGFATFFGFTESGDGQPFGQAPFYTGGAARGMTIQWTFEFPLSALDLAIVQNSGVLPKPTGVTASIVQRF